MLIVEGPDGSGKTSLVNLLKEELGIGVAPRVVSKDAEAMVDLKQWVDDNLDAGLVPQIFDRHRLISEPIYGSILRPEASSGFNELSWLGPRMTRFYKLRPLIIYCLPSEEAVMGNIMGDPDNQAIAEHARKIYRAYVARTAQDYVLAPKPPLVWNYEQSPTIKGKPAWLPIARDYINQLLQERSSTPLW